MKLRVVRSGVPGLVLGSFAALCPENIGVLVNEIKAPLDAGTLFVVRFLGLIVVSIGASRLFGESAKSTAMWVQLSVDALIALFCIYQWYAGFASAIGLTFGVVMMVSVAPLVEKIVEWVRKSPRDILYDLQRKRAFMENDTKINITLITGRAWTYIYDVAKRNQNFIEHADSITKVLRTRFNMKFPWNGGRIYDQQASENMATLEGDKCFVMSSSGYCAMSQQKDVLEYAIDQARKAGPNYGSYAVIGFNEQVNQLHRTLEKYYQREAAMVAASGYLACQNIVDSCISILSTSGDKSLVIMDRASHPCLRQGAQAADKVLYFKHNDAKDASRLLKEHAGKYKNRILIIESVYSTDGDIGDLPAFRKVCDDFQCTFIVDDAHGLGVLGPNGGGVEEHWNMRGAADFICGTLSKSCSAQGGFVVSNNKTAIGMLVMTPGVGFATGMNAFSAAFSTKALEFIMANGSKQVAEASSLRDYMREKITTRFQLPVEDNPTRLLTIRLEHPTRAMHVQREMQRLGYLISAMTFPAVPMNQSLLRMTIVPGILTRKVIDGFCDALEEALRCTAKLSLETNSYLLFNSVREAEEADAREQRSRAIGMAA